MNLLLQECLEELFLSLDSSKEVQELVALKEDIYKDPILKEKLESIRKIDNIYDPRYMELKREIVSSPKIARFHELENELYFMTLEINKKLDNLFGKKGCSNASN